jgi:hypothetical protein
MDTSTEGSALHCSCSVLTTRSHTSTWGAEGDTKKGVRGRRNGEVEEGREQGMVDVGMVCEGM